MSKPKLLEQVNEQIRLRHYGHRTEKTYILWIKKYIYYHQKRHSAEMSSSEINNFLSYLASEKHVAASTQNQALNAILFLYRNVLDMEIEIGEKFVRQSDRNIFLWFSQKKKSKMSYPTYMVFIGLWQICYTARV